ncbi:hemerythrin domain-containing protein [Nonomuraea angiospora]
MGTQQDMIQLLVTDHHEVEEMFTQLERMSGDGGEQAKTLAEKLVIELVRHSVAEEEYLYPAVREYVPGGGKLADQESPSTPTTPPRSSNSPMPNAPRRWCGPTSGSPPGTATCSTGSTSRRGGAGPGSAAPA